MKHSRPPRARSDQAREPREQLTNEQTADLIDDERSQLEVGDRVAIGRTGLIGQVVWISDQRDTARLELFLYPTSLLRRLPKKGAAQ